MSHHTAAESDSYRAVGLRGNPFAWPDDDGGAAAVHIPVLTVDAPNPGRCRLVQVVGGRGAGKTTTLRAWAACAPGPIHWVPPEGVGRWQPPPVAPIVYWDELDRLPAAVLRRALRRAARHRATVVAGTHVDLTLPATRAGLAVDTVSFPPLTGAALGRWFDASVERTAIGAGAPVMVSRPSEDELARVALAAGTSWRDAGDALHAWVARAVRAHVGETAVGSVG